MEHRRYAPKMAEEGIKTAVSGRTEFREVLLLDIKHY
jgi:hypothetical protein